MAVAALLAMNIVDGFLTFKEIKSKRMREKVRTQLELLGEGHLATEE